MNVVIYARYSSNSQTEQSIEGQLKECYQYAKQNDYTVITEYIDRALTGTNDHRPNFLKMIEDSNKKCFQGIIVYQLDRFARNRYDSARYKAKLKKNGVRVLSAREHITDDASGILLESMLEGMAEYYSVELSQKIKRGIELNAMKCLYHGGTIPLGLKVDKDKKYQIDEETAPIVRKVFEMYSNGYIMADIIRFLNENNIKTSYKKPFNKNSIRTILLNKKYIGIYSYKGKDTPNAIPSIINEKIFYKVQEMMNKNKKAPARARAKAEYLLTTKLYCGHCKNMMTGYSGTSRNGTLYNYYICNNAKKKICKKKIVQKEYIENLIIQEARNVLTDENINNIAENVVKLAKEENNTNTMLILEKTLLNIDKQKNNLLDSLKVCNIESVRQVLFEEIAKIEEEKKKTELQIKIEKSKNIDITIPEVKYFLYGIRKGSVDNENYRKLLINVLINKVYLYDDNMTIIFNSQKQPFDKKIPQIEELESSFMGNKTAPNFIIFLRYCRLSYNILIYFKVL